MLDGVQWAGLNCAGRIEGGIGDCDAYKHRLDFFAE